MGWGWDGDKKLLARAPTVSDYRETNRGLYLQRDNKPSVQLNWYYKTRRPG